MAVSAGTLHTVLLLSKYVSCRCGLMVVGRLQVLTGPLCMDCPAQQWALGWAGQWQCSACCWAMPWGST